MTRKALKDFTFSDGTRIPAGVFVSPSMMGTHYDDANYEHPNIFNPWRFSDMDIAEIGKKNGMVDTSTEHLAFGHGKHAW